MIHSILVEADNYPELKADQGFLDMQKSINNIEEELAAVKRSYNASVTEYNNKVELFPTNLIANLFGFKRRTLIENKRNSDGNIDISQYFKR